MGPMRWAVRSPETSGIHGICQGSESLLGGLSQPSQSTDGRTEDASGAASLPSQRRTVHGERRSELGGAVSRTLRSPSLNSVAATLASLIE